MPRCISHCARHSLAGNHAACVVVQKPRKKSDKASVKTEAAKTAEEPDKASEPAQPPAPALPAPAAPPPAAAAAPTSAQAAPAAPPLPTAPQQQVSKNACATHSLKLQHGAGFAQGCMPQISILSRIEPLNCRL